MSIGLIAFLRARLTEGDDEAERKHDLGCNAIPSVITLGEGPCDCGLSARLHHEITAIRSILDEHDCCCCVKAMCCGEIEEWFDAESGDPCPTLRHLGAIWSGHPDYREEWKPQAAG